MKFGLKPEHYHLISTKIAVPIRAAGGALWVFGSRATTTHHPFSDLDLLYTAPESDALNQTLMKALADLQESSIPIKIDLVKDTSLAESYRPQIEATKVVF